MPTAFPDGFRWGTATAAHQIEGGNWNNDWWQWEHTPGSGCVEPSGDACDSWNRWQEDVAILAELGFDNYRFSIEWSRIEPEEGEWSAAAIEHYRRVGEGLLEVGIDPVITFHHFTTPRWLAGLGGWTDPKTAERFAAFCGRAARELAPVLRRACTINEPNIVSTMGFMAGVFPPGKRDVELRRSVNRVFVDAHRKGVAAIRSAAPGVPVGLTLSMSDYQAVDGGEAKRDQIRYRMEDEVLEGTAGDDFVGVQTYSRTRVGPDGPLPNEDGVDVLIMGYEFWPESLGATIRRAWEVTGGNVPILVTENGIGTDDDTQRIEYV
ncbi:MAG TPA: family 1 glycosylhydrolase, partial [Acidimicrobiales bacterium]|nr:family 1 glycosylhydrolase [Acidimicrobiales bacterium]